METDFLVFPHLGLGDQLIMNGYIHYLLQTQNPRSILIIAYDNYQNKTLEHLYSDFPQVHFHRIEHPNGRFSPFISSLNGKPFRSTVYLHDKPYILLNFGLHSQYNSATIGNNSWADSFYIQGALDPSHRFSYFHLPSNMNNSKIIYERITSKIGKEYILVNDEPKSNRNINAPLLHMLLKKSGNYKLPVIYLGIERYKYSLVNELNNVDLSEELRCDSLLDLWEIIQNAKECHFMDSSIACMTDLIKDSKSDLHLHEYMTHTVNPSCPIFVNRKWSIWYDKDLIGI